MGKYKHVLFAVLLGGFMLLLSGCSLDGDNLLAEQKSADTETDIFHVEKMFSKDDLFCPENGEDRGRLSKRQCYVPVPCYETGERLKNIVCDEARDVGGVESFRSDPYPHAL